ncbi:tetratricopeptide repeat protein [Rhodococcus koreensis]|uniref:tetratricopeptide repeat protein n=1 Tax=Rhodococcus koreensis TaxID=99653 RepID=UPI0036718313
MALLEAPVSWRLIAAALVFAVFCGSELDKWHTRRIEQREAEQQEQHAREAAESAWKRAAEDCLQIWPAPPIRDVDPYKHLGVARSLLAGSFTQVGDLVPPYVERDIDQWARERLQSSGAVLLIGTPASGVTRSAYQLALTAPASSVALIPTGPQGLATALGELDVLSRLPSGARPLLWLGGIDSFTPGLTSAMLRRCRERPGMRIVATISSTQYEVWEAENRLLAEEFGEPRLLKRVPSAQELKRAEAAYPGVEFSEGIAAAFTVAAELLKQLHSGDGTCPYERVGDDCALAREVVDIAIGWASTDIGRPLPISQLSVLAQQRMGGPKINGEHLERALIWTIAPVVGSASLLVRETDSKGREFVTARTDIVEIRRAESGGPDEAVWLAALDAAACVDDREAIGRIGFRAHIEGKMNIASQTWAMVTALDDPAVASLWRAMAFSHGRHEPAGEVPLLERLLELTEATFDPDHREVARLLTRLGIAWLELGKPANAQEPLERALTVQEREYGPNDPEVALTLNNLGNVRCDQGKPDEARKLYERALTILEREYGPNHPEVALTLNNLGRVWRDLGELDAAEKALEWALPILEREYGPNHRVVASSLHNLGNVRCDQGKPDEARKLYERALTIREREYGPNHPEVAATLNILGRVWRDLGELDAAEEVLERALTILEREYAPNHPEVARTLGTLGNVRSDRGKPDEARKLYERALTIQEREYGPNHPEVAATLNNLGTELLLQEPAKARKLYERALNILRSHFPDGHPMIAIVERNLRDL